MFNKILVVCVGNICRSPTAERLLKQFHPALTVSPVGLGALVGKSADPCVINVAQERNLPLDSHCVWQISGRICREYDLILAMKKHHISTSCEVAPETRGKMMSSGHWDNKREIPDPYRKGRDTFDAVYALLEWSVRQWTQTLNTEQRKQR